MARLLPYRDGLVKLDPQWRIEMAFLQAACGEPGQATLHEQFMQCLPTDTKGTTLAEAVQNIRLLQASKLSSFVSTAI